VTTRDGIGPSDQPAIGPRADLLEQSIDRHPTAIGRRLDLYLAAAAEALRDRGVLTGSPQRTDAAHRLIGSIVLDCTAVRIAAWSPTAHPDPGRRSLGGVVHPGRPAPVIATWDEQEGWSVGLHEDPGRSSRRTRPSVPAVGGGRVCGRGPTSVPAGCTTWRPGCAMPSSRERRVRR
jgi:hypothetical protein